MLGYISYIKLMAITIPFIALILIVLSNKIDITIKLGMSLILIGIEIYIAIYGFNFIKV